MFIKINKMWVYVYKNKRYITRKEFYMKREERIQAIMKDLEQCISFDEWSAREYGNIVVDYWYTAHLLYEMGYRKVKKNNTK